MFLTQVFTVDELVEPFFWEPSTPIISLDLFFVGWVGCPRECPSHIMKSICRGIG